MLLANWLATRFLADRDFPAFYRSQPEPRESIDREETKELLDLWRDRRRLSRVVMELAPHPHWGLGLPLYTFATSPIRRYLDLVSHRQLHRAIQGAAPVYGADDLEEILSTIEPAMRRAGLVKADPDIGRHLSETELEELFDLSRHLRYRDTLLARVFGAKPGKA